MRQSILEGLNFSRPPHPPPFPPPPPPPPHGMPFYAPNSSFYPPPPMMPPQGRGRGMPGESSRAASLVFGVELVHVKVISYMNHCTGFQCGEL